MARASSNAHSDELPAGDALDTPPRDGQLPDRPFVPTPAQLRYLATWLDPAGPDTITQLAAAARVNRRTVYDWLEDPRFCLWFTTHVERVFLADRLRMWKRCLELAIKGSPDHIKLVAQRAGELRPEFPGNNSDRTGGMQVFINVPRPRPQLDQATEQLDTIDVMPAVLPVVTSSEEH